MASHTHAVEQIARAERIAQAERAKKHEMSQRMRKAEEALYEDDLKVHPMMRKHLGTFQRACYQMISEWINEAAKDPVPPHPAAIKFSFPGWPVVHLTVGLDNIKGDVDTDTPVMNEVLSMPMALVNQVVEEDENIADYKVFQDLLKDLFLNMYQQMMIRRRQTPYVTGIQYSSVDRVTPVATMVVDEADPSDLPV